MPKYKKLPVEIEAVQMPSANGDFTLAPLWLAEARDQMRVFHETDDEFVVETLEGAMRGQAGDYIIKGVEGELYPCARHIFEKTYVRSDR